MRGALIIAHFTPAILPQFLVVSGSRLKRERVVRSREQRDKEEEGRREEEEEE